MSDKPPRRDVEREKRRQDRQDADESERRRLDREDRVEELREGWRRNHPRRRSDDNGRGAGP